MSERINYEGKIFGTRKIIKNYCLDEDWEKAGREKPKNFSEFRLGECLCCGMKMPVHIKSLMRTPPKKCAYCSGINNKSNIKNTNRWTLFDNYAELNLTFKGQPVTGYVDIEDYSFLSSMIWRVSKKKNKIYLITGSRKNQKYMHRVLIKTEIPDGYEVDHLDGNSLNNRKDNLKVVTRLENIQNSGARFDNQIGIRGISWSKRDKKYKADFSFNKTRFYFKGWDTIEEAVFCRKVAEEYFGLQILNRNPLSKQYLTLSENEEKQIKKYVISTIENKIRRNPR